MTHDLVVRLDGEKVDGVDDLVRLLDRNRIDKPVQVDVLRLGRPRAFTVTPKERAAAK
jgi:S1-C subfamily serine protease